MNAKSLAGTNIRKSEEQKKEQKKNKKKNKKKAFTAITRSAAYSNMVSTALAATPVTASQLTFFKSTPKSVPPVADGGNGDARSKGLHTLANQPLSGRAVAFFELDHRSIRRRHVKTKML
jgi:hypothetical protein